MSTKKNRKRSKDSNHKCGGCPYVTMNSDRFERHQKRCSEMRLEYLCFLCGHSYGYMKTLKYHVAQHHHCEPSKHKYIIRVLDRKNGKLLHSLYSLLCSIYSFFFFYFLILISLFLFSAQYVGEFEREFGARGHNDLNDGLHRFYKVLLAQRKACDSVSSLTKVQKQFRDSISDRLATDDGVQHLHSDFCSLFDAATLSLSEDKKFRTLYFLRK